MTTSKRFHILKIKVCACLTRAKLESSHTVEVASLPPSPPDPSELDASSTSLTSSNQENMAASSQRFMPTTPTPVRQAGHVVGNGPDTPPSGRVNGNYSRTPFRQRLDSSRTLFQGDAGEQPRITPSHGHVIGEQPPTTPHHGRVIEPITPPSTNGAPMHLHTPGALTPGEGVPTDILCQKSPSCSAICFRHMTQGDRNGKTNAGRPYLKCSNRHWNTFDDRCKCGAKPMRLEVGATEIRRISLCAAGVCGFFTIVRIGQADGRPAAYVDEDVRTLCTE
ncbi:hypothetical protein CLCR_08966 [Cladophialophora carrionii]|uniref:Uncharacterized protein n=1 Tax=Cladophialophora carrionii TaxID=86049 RepID=A0A1C1CU78_9EURO|nr:hypothetical protein CLCR_08966 [Cladophialophora carrionii]